jgi:hypothetical protein
MLTSPQQQRVRYLTARSPSAGEFRELFDCPTYFWQDCQFRNLRTCAGQDGNDKTEGVLFNIYLDSDFSYKFISIKAKKDISIIIWTENLHNFPSFKN